MTYDRMNPDPKQLLEKLKKYSQIDYGINALTLSKAEVKEILLWLEISDVAYRGVQDKIKELIKQVNKSDV